MHKWFCRVDAVSTVPSATVPMPNIVLEPRGAHSRVSSDIYDVAHLVMSIVDFDLILFPLSLALVNRAHLEPTPH